MPTMHLNPHVPKVLRAGLAALAVSAIATGLAAGPAFAAGNADLTIAISANPSRVPTGGGISDVKVDVANIGGATADDVSVSLRLPANTYVSGELPGGESPWQCASVALDITCTHPALPAGTPAPDFSLPVRLPAGADGQSVKVFAQVSTSSPEKAATNEAKTTITYDASVVIPEPHGANIGFVSAGTAPWQVVAGDYVRLDYELRNYGDEPANDVTLRVTLPPTLQPVWYSTGGWQCTQLSDGWDCAFTSGPIDAGADVPEADFTAIVVGGAPGDLLTVDAVAGTSSPELSTDDNSMSQSLEYVDPATKGTIRGQLWLDADKDGQREPGELPVDPAAMFVEVWLWPTYGNRVSVPVNADGTYRVTMTPGEYTLEVRVPANGYSFTTPDVGDDATDSDVSISYQDAYQVYARSNASYIDGGTDLVVDAGVIRTS